MPSHIFSPRQCLISQGEFYNRRKGSSTSWTAVGPIRSWECHLRFAICIIPKMWVFRDFIFPSFLLVVHFGKSSYLKPSLIIIVFTEKQQAFTFNFSNLCAIHMYGSEHFLYNNSWGRGFFLVGRTGYQTTFLPSHWPFNQGAAHIFFHQKPLQLLLFMISSLSEPVNV